MGPDIDSSSKSTVPLYMTLHEARNGLREGRFTSRELTKAHLDRISAVDDRVRAFISVTSNEALKMADCADNALREGTAGSLTGIPIAIKDIITTAGIPTTCGSRMLENFTPVEDAFVVQRLRDAGVVIIGKANLDEFAMGSSTEHSAFFPTSNPWDLKRVPGGSSGGSAAAVAAGESPISLGSDTGGSIRQPSSFCGIVGMKPTYGRVSRRGLVAFASSLDQIGPFAHTARDAAALLQEIAGYDLYDSTSADLPVPDFSRDLEKGLDGITIAVPREYFDDTTHIESQITEGIEGAIGILQSLGAAVDRTASLPTSMNALPVYYVIAPSEASANLARYDGVTYGFSDVSGTSMFENMELTRQHGFGDEVKRRIMVGTYALSAGYYDAYYVKAQKVRTLIRREFDKIFERASVVITPTTPTVAFSMGEVTNPYDMYLNDIFTIPANIAGLPAISIPCGFGENGMPFGFQLIAKHWDEAMLFRVAHAFQQVTDFHTRHPSL